MTKGWLFAVMFCAFCRLRPCLQTVMINDTESFSLTHLFSRIVIPILQISTVAFTGWYFSL